MLKHGKHNTLRIRTYLVQHCAGFSFRCHFFVNFRIVGQTVGHKTDVSLNHYKLWRDSN